MTTAASRPENLGTSTHLIIDSGARSTGADGKTLTDASAQVDRTHGSQLGVRMDTLAMVPGG